jgi:hypothetical protein
MDQSRSIPRLPAPHFEGLASSKTGQIVVGGLAGGLLGGALSSKPTVAVLLVGAVLSAIAVAAALTHPGRVFVALVLVMALIPTYAAPGVGPLLFIPAAGLSWLIVGVLAWRNAMQRGRIFRFTGIDLAVLVFGVLMYVSLSFSTQVVFNDYLNDLFAWGGPFLAARMLLQDTDRPAFLVAASFAAATVIVAPVAVLESLGKENPFTQLQFNSVEAAVWAAPASRLGQVRAEASFGHPIALSMFVAVSALLSLGMAIYSSRNKERYVWLGLAALAVGVQALTFSRTGWLILVFGIALLAVTTAVRAAKRRLAFVFAVIGVGVVGLMIGGGAPKELELFPSSSSSAEGAAFQDSGAYREALLQRALQPGVLHLWGNSVNRITPAVSSTNNATDNAYIILADEWGLIPTFALIAIVFSLLMAIVLARSRRADEMVILPIVAVTSLCALFFVAFITQQQVMIWLLVGAASAGGERVLRRNRAAVDQRREPMPER